MPRLFCALKIPASLSFELSMLNGGLTGAKWIDRENFHITLQFFGNLDRHHANDLALGLTGISRPSLELEIDRLDAFGSTKPRAIYANVKASEPLMKLQSDIDSVGRRLGLKPDKRKFIPHVTLARLRGTSPQEAAGFLALRGGFHSRPFSVTSFELMSSRASVGGGPYITEQRYPLDEYDLTGEEPLASAQYDEMENTGVSHE